MIRVASARSPGHITGFFQIAEETSDPLHTGSIGAGVNIRRGVTSVVTVEPSESTKTTIRINGRDIEAPTSQAVVDIALEKSSLHPKISVDHHCEVPIGAGFGSSGAGALSLALAINEALDLRLSRIEAAQIAHIAEIKCRTGLGTVIAETAGGIEARVSPGAPGVGEIRQIEVEGDYVVPCLSFSPILTSTVLADKRIASQLAEMGKSYLIEFLDRPTVQNLLELSLRFAFSTGLVSKRVRQVISDAEKKGFVCSMAMLGESVFSIVEVQRATALLDVFSRYSKLGGVSLLSEIDFQGAKLV